MSPSAAKFIDRIHSRVKRKKVELTLPKFRFDSTFSLLDTLVSLGMKDAFSEKADFSGMEDLVWDSNHST